MREKRMEEGFQEVEIERDIDKILKKLKDGKVVERDGIPVEV